MIEADRLDRVRKVYVDGDGGTVASNNLAVTRQGINNNGATYAVHSALNLTVAESLLLGCIPVIVEGPSDQHYLSTIKNILIANGKIHPKAELVFPPSGGAKTAKIIASILMGRDDSLPLVLLDGDTAGKQASKSLKEGLYAGAKQLVLSTDEFVGHLDNSEIEDLLPAELLVEIIDRIVRADKEFEEEHESAKPIIHQIKNWAKNENITLPNDWKIQLSLDVKAKLSKNPDRYIDNDRL